MLSCDRNVCRTRLSCKVFVDASCILLKIPFEPLLQSVYMRCTDVETPVLFPMLWMLNAQSDSFPFVLWRPPLEGSRFGYLERFEWSGGLSGAWRQYRHYRRTNAEKIFAV